MGDKNKLSNIPNVLKEKANLSWQKLIEQYPAKFEQLSTQQRHDFKLALGFSDFVFKSSSQAPDLVIALFISEQVYSVDVPDYQLLLSAKLKGCQDEVHLHRILREFRLQQMVLIACSDLVFNIDLDVSLARLSKLADALILEALHWLTKLCQSKWGIPENELGVEQSLLVFGMGKLGGEELNFSSDIDLIFSYPQRGATTGCRRSIDNQQFFTRLSQKLITALNQQTVDGFVYRVDMRLRPFGDSGPLVMNFNALEDYYQEQGRDWERYAMLKARLIGEGPFHQKLLKMLKPFVYRRYIDFSVIDSLRRMKMMIAQEVRRKNLVNNIKLGAGGIREVEFIVQVFQLIRGGRVIDLQQRNLLSVLPQLVTHQEISQESANTLASSYRFLRRAENIIQAINDQQSQTLPDNMLDQSRLITVLGFTTWAEFLKILDVHMQNVHHEFSRLIGEDSPNHEAQDQHWQALWQSDWSNDESESWISQHYTLIDPQLAWHHLQHFRADLIKRSLGNRGRAVLDKLIPILLWNIQQNKADDITLARILSVLTKVASRTAYLELLYENEGALKQLIKLCRASSWITEYLAKFPILLDELIDPKLLNSPLSLSSYQDELRVAMLRIPVDDLELQMDTLRQFKQAQQLRIAAADISGVLALTKVSDHLTALAETLINEVVNIAWQHVSKRFGVPKSTLTSNNKGFAVIGYGKVGGIELGYSSDLDLVFLHNSPEGDSTNGVKEVLAGQFYSKLAQRIMHIFNTRMSSGILYELDLRLRPSGNAGLLVVHIETYQHYLQNDAWNWEHQALVRARLIYGNKALNSEFSNIRRNILTSKRNPETLREEVLEMREKMRGHLDKSNNELSDLKQDVGGLVDIEFLAQYLVLMHSSSHPNVAIYSDNIRIFKELNESGLINNEQKELLINSYCQLRGLGHQAALQNETNLINKEAFKESTQEIAIICNVLMN